MDVDDATSAMIAKLLGEENPYVEDFEEPVDDPDDSDYDAPARKRAKRNAQGKVRNKPRKSRTQQTPNASPTLQDTPTAPANQNATPNSTKQDKSNTGRRKRKDAGVQRTKGRQWSDKEEVEFLKGLEIYGRDWRKIAEHMGSRDSRAVGSHAQKHFIKLCMAGSPLPQKVLESGRGYTLSGKLLDPTSSSALAYGFRPHLLKNLSEEKLEIAMKGILADKLEDSEHAVQAKKKKRTAVSESASPKTAEDQQTVGESNTEQKPEADVEKPDATPTVNGTTGMEVEEPVPEKQDQAEPVNNPNLKTVEIQQSEGDQQEQGAPLAVPEVTEYVKNRPKRVAAMKTAQMGHTTESLDLVECLNFVGVPGSGSATAQPFSVEVDSQVLLTMDCHAHLSECEIIGLLGGSWDPSVRQLKIMEAFPCARAVGSEARTSVELDAESEVKARSQMQEKGLIGVGWYHSHPIFEPTPSKKDMENQRNYQALFRDDEFKVEPFIGFIVAPYDAQLLTPKSALTAFIVQEKDKCLHPFRIKYDTVTSSNLATPGTISKLHELFEALKGDVARVNLNDTWRPFRDLNSATPQPDPLTKAQKFRIALKTHFPEESQEEADEVINSLCHFIQTAWEVDIGFGKEVNGANDTKAS